MAKKLSMKFATTLGGEATLAVDEPKAGLAADIVRTTMQSIIDKNVFLNNKGDYSQIKSAEIVTTTVEKLI